MENILAPVGDLAAKIAGTDFVPGTFAVSPQRSPGPSCLPSNWNLPPMTTLKNTYVVHGTLTCPRRAQRALVLAAGHESSSRVTPPAARCEAGGRLRGLDASPVHDGRGQTVRRLLQERQLQESPAGDADRPLHVAAVLHDLPRRHRRILLGCQRAAGAVRGRHRAASRTTEGHRPAGTEGARRRKPRPNQKPEPNSQNPPRSQTNRPSRARRATRSSTANRHSRPRQRNRRRHLPTTA